MNGSSETHIGEIDNKGLLIKEKEISSRILVEKIFNELNSGNFNKEKGSDQE
jgi:hypothetical protein